MSSPLRHAVLSLAAASCLLGGFASRSLADTADEPRMRRDVEYSQPDGASLTLDAFTPAGPGPFPACILVHGGGFTKGDKHSYITPIFEPLGKAGFAWFTIDYRLAPAHRWPAPADDVAAAIRWVKSHAAEYKVDPRRIAIIGESAGGHLVSWVGVHSREGAGSEDASDVLAKDANVAAVVPFYAPHDLELQVRNRKDLGDSMRGLLGLTELNDEAHAALRAASPIAHVAGKLPPFLLIHGDKDAQVPLEQSTRFQEAMQSAGNSCELIVIPGGGHGMGGWDKLGSDYRERMIEWLKKTLK